MLLCAVALAFAAGCGSSEGGEKSDSIAEGQGRISGVVTDQASIPLKGVTLAVADTKATTDEMGRFRLDAAAGSEVIRFSKKGFAASSLAVTVTAGAETSVQEGLVKRSDPIDLDMDEGGTIGETARVTLSPGALVAADGTAAEGEIAAYITPLDIVGDLTAAPGDFSAVRDGGGDTRLETLGMAEYYFEDGEGNPLNVAKGKTVEVELAIPEDIDAAAGDVIPAWYFDVDTGRWVEDGEGKVVDDDNGGLVWRVRVSHFSWWNADVPIDERDCVTGTITDCHGDPVSGASVSARGLDYRGESSAYPDADGSYCVDIKRGSEVDLLVVGTVDGNRVGKRVQVTGGDSGASCEEGSDGCQERNIKLPCDEEDSDLDCGESPLLPCKACVSGRIVTEEGDPPQDAVISLGDTYGGFGAKAIVDDDGTFCLPAPLDVPVMLTANAAGYPPSTQAVTATEEGECPHCQDLGDIVLEEKESGGSVFEQCNQGEVTIEAVDLDGADESLAELPHIGMMIVDDESSETMPGYLWLSDADDPEDSEGSSSILLVFEIPRSARADESADLTGFGNFNSGGVVGVNSEMYTIDTGSLTWNEAIRGAGQTLTGALAFQMATSCGMAVRTIRFEGSFTTEVLDIMTYGSSLQCVGITTAVAALGQTSTGIATLKVDGKPVSSTASSSASYAPDDDQLSLVVTEEEGIMFGLVVDEAAFDTQEISHVWVSDAASGCFYEASGVPELAIEQNDASNLGRGPLEGSFEAELSSSSSDCTEPLSVSGTFMAAICAP
ncbi:MAG: carboxypeptidase regulatory-like domain-containing protein [Polyangiaceae bacterium]|nr:carboxypeptidase regulatory-like domain-containing protein [Polyangiaceae bacterium]